MNKPWILPASILFSLSLAAGCGDQAGQKGKEQATNEASQATPLTPATANGEHYVSPLAQMMRDMTAFADSTKQHLMRGEDLLPYPAAFKGMLTAEATPGMMDHRTFDPFAFNYLHQLDSLYKVVPDRRQAAFDELVQYCAACHGQVCPGPLVRIKKLRMPTAAE